MMGGFRRYAALGGKKELPESRERKGHDKIGGRHQTVSG